MFDLKTRVMIELKSALTNPDVPKQMKPKENSSESGPVIEADMFKTNVSPYL
jgi:hypothetical protein